MHIDMSLAAKILATPLSILFKHASSSILKKILLWKNEDAKLHLASKISAYEKVKTIWQPGKEVHLSTFYYPLRIEYYHESFEKHPIRSLRDIPSVHNYVVEGLVGQGKSMFMRWLCIMELSSQGSGRIPVFIELRILKQKYTLYKAVCDTFETLGFEINKQLFQHYADSGAFVLLLDGFDELDEQITGAVIDQLHIWCQRHEKMQIICSSRPYGEIQKSEHFRLIKLLYLEKNEYKDFYKKINVTGTMLKGILEAIDNNPVDACGLLKTPLLLTLVWWVYQAHQKIPNTLSDFYDKLFETVVFKHDATKPGFRRKYRTALTPDDLESLFNTFCFYSIHSNYGVSLSKDNYKKCFKSSTSYLKINCSAEDFLEDATKLLCLLQQDGHRITFIHKSLTEYHAASFLTNLSDKRMQQFFRKFRNTLTKHNKWQHVLIFLSDIDKHRYTKYLLVPCSKFVISIFNKYQGKKHPAIHCFSLIISTFYFSYSRNIMLSFDEKTNKKMELSRKLCSAIFHSITIACPYLATYSTHMMRALELDKISTIKTTDTLATVHIKILQHLNTRTHPRIYDKILHETSEQIQALKYELRESLVEIASIEARDDFIFEL